jgi:C-terminal processing protease CtpA/Prc
VKSRFPLSQQPQKDFKRKGRIGFKSITLSLISSAVLMACGGADGDSIAPASSTNTSGTTATASNTYAQQCSPSNPYSQDAKTSTTIADLTTEKKWARAYVDEAYLWYSEVPTVDANAPAYSQDTPTGFYDSLNGYFGALKVKAKDHFSFIYSTKAWNDLSQSGVEKSSGAVWAITTASVPRVIRATQIYPNTPAATAGLRRGDKLISVNGYAIATDTSEAALKIFNAFVFGQEGAAGPFNIVVNRNGVDQSPINIDTKALALSPVPLAQTLTNFTTNEKLGYLLFNEHNAVAEGQLTQAIQSFKAANIKDLVLDLRYNGGGYLYIASQLAYMIAGPQASQNKLFLQEIYNDKRAQESNAAAAKTPFLGTSSNGKTALPTLNLSRVYVLTSPNTCSASEAIINGLEGIGLQVHRIGSTTCGKPYGFTAHDNCGLSYFAIEFKASNDKGFGDYANGFKPECEASDDFDHPLGDPNEGQLAAALTLRDTGTCASASRAQTLAASADAQSVPRLLRHPVKEGMEGTVIAPQ